MGNHEIGLCWAIKKAAYVGAVMKAVNGTAIMKADGIYRADGPSRRRPMLGP